MKDSFSLKCKIQKVRDLIEEAPNGTEGRELRQKCENKLYALKKELVEALECEIFDE